MFKFKFKNLKYPNGVGRRKPAGGVWQGNYREAEEKLCCLAEQEEGTLGEMGWWILPEAMTSLLGHPGSDIMFSGDSLQFPKTFWLSHRILTECQSIALEWWHHFWVTLEEMWHWCNIRKVPASCNLCHRLATLCGHTIAMALYWQLQLQWGNYTSGGKVG